MDTSDTFDLLAYEQQPELALAALLQMMSRFPQRQSPALADAILGHLCLVSDDERYPEPLRQCAEQLLELWGNYAQQGCACPASGPVAGMPRHRLH